MAGRGYYLHRNNTRDVRVHYTVGVAKTQYMVLYCRRLGPRFCEYDCCFVFRELLELRTVVRIDLRCIFDSSG